jgi:type IV pilus assembly protein PilC
MDIFRSKSLSLFYRELSTLLASGMPVVQAMGELVQHVSYGLLRNTVWHIQADLEQGGTLAGAFAKFPQVFPEWQVGVIEAGEKTGRLAEMLKMIADQTEKNYADTLKLIVGLSYPAFLLVVALILLPFIRIGTCPTNGCASGVYRNLFLLALICCGGYFLLRKAGARSSMQAVALATPVFGKMVRQFAITRFVRALQSLTAAGVPILTGWRVAAGASGNELARANVFPAYMIGMISSGEKSGSIVKMLDSAAVFCEKENEAAIGVLLKVVPVIVYIAVASFVGLTIISTYSRYYNSILTLQ